MAPLTPNLVCLARECRNSARNHSRKRAFPATFGHQLQWHHGLDAWDGDPQSWLMGNVIEEYFGPSPDVETLVERGGLLQREGYKALFEEARRQKPRCSMALNWCFNEPWPTAANNSLISWPARPKAGYFGVQIACRVALAQRQNPEIRVAKRRTFEAQVWILNDAPDAQEGGTMEALCALASKKPSC
jgi:beta-mannosidase